MSAVRVGVIGLGWGELQIQAMHRVQGVHVVAVCDADAARLQQAARINGIERTFADYNDLVNSNQVDLVAIAAPPDLHERMVRTAIQAGKHVFCEKPVSLTSRRIRDLAALADERGLIHAVDFEMRYLPGHAYAKELIDEGYLGPLHRVDVNLTMERPWGEHGNWASDASRGGGVLMELGTHFLDTLHWLFGAPSAVLAETRTYFPTIRMPSPKGETNGKSVIREVTGDDAFWCVLQFARGGEGLVNFVTGARHDAGWTIGAYGQSGSLLIRSGQLWGMRDGEREFGLLPIPKRLELANKPDDPLMWAMARLIEQVVAAINEQKYALPFPTFQEAFAVAKTIEAVRQSSHERCWKAVE